MIVLADNQREIATRLSAASAAHLLLLGPDFKHGLLAAMNGMLVNPSGLQRMSAHAAALVRCSGTVELVRRMKSFVA